MENPSVEHKVAVIIDETRCSRPRKSKLFIFVTQINSNGLSIIIFRVNSFTKHARSLIPSYLYLIMHLMLI